MHRATLWLRVALLTVIVIGVLTSAAFSDADAMQEDRLWARGLPSSLGAERIDRDTFANLAAQASPAVVNIFTTQTLRKRGLPLVPFSPLIPGLSYSAGNRTNLGTGFIIHEDGYVLTNRHVVGEATDIQVHLYDESVYPARVVKMVVPELDIVLLRIEADRPLPVLAFGDSDTLRVGDWVMAIGNAFGLGHTVTTGTISNLIRVRMAEVETPATRPLGIIQTDASINPGNSGGPLLNLEGHVIGVNTAMLRSGQNIGFALAINSVKRQLPTRSQVALQPAVTLGISVMLLNPGEAETTYANRALAGRLKIENVVRGSAGARARLSEGDVILAIDGREIETFQDLQEVLAHVAPGARMEWTIRRGDSTRTIAVTGEAPDR